MFVSYKESTDDSQPRSRHMLAIAPFRYCMCHLTDIQGEKMGKDHLSAISLRIVLGNIFITLMQCLSHKQCHAFISLKNECDGGLCCGKYCTRDKGDM